MPIYLIQAAGDDGPLKIGHAADPARRLHNLRIGSPVPLLLLGTRPGSRAEESRLHKRFARHRIRGEWFRYSPEIMKLAWERSGTDWASPGTNGTRKFTLGAAVTLEQYQAINRAAEERKSTVSRLVQEILIWWLAKDISVFVGRETMNGTQSE